MIQHVLGWGERLARSGKTLFRRGFCSLARMLPNSVTDRLPVLGRVCVTCPDGQPLRLWTWGLAGKDRLALKLHRRGWLAWEPETLPVFVALLPAVCGFIDIGANTGLFALLAARNDFSRRVLAFEPAAAIHAMLVANVRANGLSNLTAERLALSDRSGPVSFYVTRTGGGIPLDSSLVWGFRDNVEEVRVAAVTLDGYLAEHDFWPVDLLKIDVESAEMAVLRGARETLRQHRPAIICEILRRADTAGLHELLHPLGYRYYHLTPGGAIPKRRIEPDVEQQHRNFLFLPEGWNFPALPKHWERKAVA